MREVSYDTCDTAFDSQSKSHDLEYHSHLDWKYVGSSVVYLSEFLCRGSRPHIGVHVRNIETNNICRNLALALVLVDLHTIHILAEPM